MKKILIFSIMFLTALSCVGCSDSTNSGSDEKPDETPEVSNGLNVLDKQVASTNPGHGTFDTKDSTNKTIKLQFYLPSTGKNNAYLTADFTQWNIEGTQNYLLEYVEVNSLVFSNLYEIELKVPNDDIEFKVYLLDTENPNYSIETFEIKKEQLNEVDEIFTVTSYESTVNYRYDGVLTVAPYKVYDQNDNQVTTFVNFSSEIEIEQFDSWSSAIHFAGATGTSSNPLTVKDGNGLVVFQRLTKNDFYVFEGDYYVGVTTRTVSNNWIFNSPKGYVVHGQGTSYTSIGCTEYNDSDYDDISSTKELFSGGYNYMFTKKGVHGSQGTPGYGYMSMDVKFSEAEYLPADGDLYGLNAYLFINPATSIYNGSNLTTFHCDMGLVGHLNGDVVTWKVVRNSNHYSYEYGAGEDKTFYVYDDQIVTTMSWDEEKQAYSNADDLRFECITNIDGFILHITNLTTSEVFTLDQTHPGLVHQEETETSTTLNSRMLLGISYCPGRADVWNHRSNAVFKNVIILNSYVARYVSNGDYSNETMEPFYPGEESMYNGFTQSADTAGYSVGYFKDSGSIGQGSNATNYTQGSKYMIFDIDYRGM